jgi:Ca2+-binding RTX toxin-like protein
MITVEKRTLPDATFFFEWYGTPLADDIRGYGGQWNWINGGDGDDRLEGGRFPTPEGNILNGDGGNDTLLGGDAQDFLIGGDGDDLMRGGRGDDYYEVSSVGDVVVERERWASGDLGGDKVFSFIDFNLATDGVGVENLSLGSGAVYGTGNRLDNEIRGSFDNNILDGGRGVDTLYGGGGNDTFHLRTPGDVAVDNSRFGSYNYFDHDIVIAHGSFRMDKGMEEIRIQDMIGKTGNPVQNLTAVGNEWHNVMTGNAYNNNLNGLGGADTMTGGTGDDTFVFATDFNPNHIDTITDFGVGDDRLLFKRSLTELPSGALDAEAFHLGDTAQTADHRFLFDGTTLRYDADGDGAGAAVDVAVFKGAPILTAGSIFIT